MRWIVIHDRYYFPRSNHELKDIKKDEGELLLQVTDPELISGSASIESKTNEDKVIEEVSKVNPVNILSDKHLEPTESIKPAPIFETPSGSRTIEDLKARFYDVSRKVLKFRHARGDAMGPTEDELYKQMKYSKESEVKRKQHLESLLSRTPAEIAEEEALVLESRKLETAAELMLLERAEILRVLDAPVTAGKINEFQTSQELAQLTAQLMSDKSKKRKDLSIPTPGPDPQLQQLQNAHQLQQQAMHNQATAQGIQQTNQLHSHTQLQPQSLMDQKAASDSRRGTKVKNELDDSVQSTNTKGTKKGNIKKDKDLNKKTPLTGSSAIAAAIHRKLSSKEEAAYGLSYHDKLSTGVYLRSSKITTYKQALQSKIHQVLAELGISARPIMPTAKVTAKFDSLQQSISVLLETKKQADKLETEIQVLRTQRAYNSSLNNESIQ